MYSNVMLNWTILISAGLFILFIVYKVIGVFLEYKKMKKEMLPKLGQQVMALSMAKGTYTESMEVLGHVITTHCAELMTVIELNGKDSDGFVEELTVQVTREIYDSLSPSFKQTLSYYVSDKYIIQYTSRIARELIVEAITRTYASSEQDKIIQM